RPATGDPIDHAPGDRDSQADQQLNPRVPAEEHALAQYRIRHPDHEIRSRLHVRTTRQECVAQPSMGTNQGHMSDLSKRRALSVTVSAAIAAREVDPLKYRA